MKTAPNQKIRCYFKANLLKGGIFYERKQTQGGTEQMRELNNIKIIAVDHGYGNIKTANTVTPTGVTAYETEPIFSGNILEYGGIYYRIGEGHKEFIADKAMDEDYYILRELKHQVQKLIKAVKENIPSIAAALESLRDHMVLLQYQLLFNALQQDSISSRKDIISNVLKEYREVQTSIKEKTAERKDLMEQKKNCGIHFIRAGKLEEQITTLTEDIEELKSQKAMLLNRMGCQASEVKGFDSKLKELDTMQERLETQHTALTAQKEQDKEKYLEIKSGIAPENREAVHVERAAIRPERRRNLLKRLQEIYQQRYEYDTFRDADEMIYKELQEEPIYEKPKSISERLKRAMDHDLQVKKPKRKEYER